MKNKQWPLAVRQLTVCTIVLLLISFNLLKAQVPIDPRIYGQNAWLLSSINSYQDLNNLYDDVSLSGAKYMRIGGIEFNFKPLYTRIGNTVTNANILIGIIDKCLAEGMEPIVQVSFEPQNMCSPAIGTQAISQTDQAAIAASLVTFINNHYAANPPLTSIK